MYRNECKEKPTAVSSSGLDFEVEDYRLSLVAPMLGVIVTVHCLIPIAIVREGDAIAELDVAVIGDLVCQSLFLAVFAEGDIGLVHLGLGLASFLWLGDSTSGGEKEDIAHASLALHSTMTLWDDLTSEATDIAATLNELPVMTSTDEEHVGTSHTAGMLQPLAQCHTSFLVVVVLACHSDVALLEGASHLMRPSSLDAGATTDLAKKASGFTCCHTRYR